MLDLQSVEDSAVPLRAFATPQLSFDAHPFNGVVPPDPVGDVGPEHYIHATNGPDGTPVTIYDKTTGAVVAGPFLMQTLGAGTGACAAGGGDPVVLYDHLASRWLLSEFAATDNHLCVYLSRTSDPVSGGWLAYDFAVPRFPDYPKYAVWPDGYYVTTNDVLPTVYALDRNRMLAGLSAGSQRFRADALDGFNFQSLTPADLDGATAPPAGTPAFFVRHRDDEVTDAGANNATRDFIDVWQLQADFAVPSRSTFSLAASVPVSEFDSTLCGLTATGCIPQPGTATRLDPIREVVMWRAQYRNFGTYQTLVGTFSVDVDGSDHAGLRWFELRRTGSGAWSLYQEGTYAPDAHHRWLGSIAMDGSGNLALGFSISSATMFPGMRYTGRRRTDAPGVMTQGDVVVAAGTEAQRIAERWGDYAAMSVDPVDDCTFWFTSEYIATGGRWQTRVARFRQDAPTCTDAVAPRCGNGTREVGEDCDGADATACAGVCGADCTCPSPVCGNGAAEVGEECDGASASGCATGVCNADCTCSLCGVAPAATGCLQAGTAASTVQIVDNATDTKDRVKWSWTKGEATTTEDFGDPVNSGPSYALCVYDGSGATQPILALPVAGGEVCGSKSCWKQTRTGYKYSNRQGNAAGVTQVTLKAAADGAAAVKLQGKGAALQVPVPTLTLPVTVQFVADVGTSRTCWETRYTTATRNDAQQFKAKGP